MFYILEEMHQFCLCSEPEHVLSELNLRIWLRALAICTHAVNQKASCSHPRVSTNFVDYCLSYGLCYFLLILIGSSSGWRCHLAALLGQKKIKKADVCWLYACHVDHSSFRGRYEIVVSQLSEMSTGRCACRTRRSITTSSCECSGASDCGCRPYGGATRCRQRLSSQNNDTVNFSTNQRAAYDSPCLFLLFLVHGRLHFSQVHYASQR